MGKHDPALQLSGTGSLQPHRKSQGQSLLLQVAACPGSSWLIPAPRGHTAMDLIPTEDAQILCVWPCLSCCHRQFVRCETPPVTAALPLCRTHLVALLGPSPRAVPSLLWALVVLADRWVQLGRGDRPVLESLEMFRKEISCKLGHC